MDLMGDDAKRRAFAAAAHASVQGRTWPALSAELVRHYRAVMAGEPVVEPVQPAVRRAPVVAPMVAPVTPTVAVPAQTKRGVSL
jgi:phosphatidylinositol alpha 1,6-mannosyltransferase